MEKVIIVLDSMAIVMFTFSIVALAIVWVRQNKIIKQLRNNSNKDLPYK